mmetsp:Transcript_2407/g.7234  ORF Transcript_2407/g.7234 Transcript_2407/m.7234 type:complete len:288 (+) Transcript_2407:765-1628(+)
MAQWDRHAERPRDGSACRHRDRIPQADISRALRAGHDTGHRLQKVGHDGDVQRRDGRPARQGEQDPDGAAVGDHAAHRLGGPPLADAREASAHGRRFAHVSGEWVPHKHILQCRAGRRRVEGQGSHGFQFGGDRWLWRTVQRRLLALPRLYHAEGVERPDHVHAILHDRVATPGGHAIVESEIPSSPVSLRCSRVPKSQVHAACHNRRGPLLGGNRGGYSRLRGTIAEGPGAPGWGGRAPRREVPGPRGKGGLGDCLRHSVGPAIVPRPAFVGKRAPGVGFDQDPHS